MHSALKESSSIVYPIIVWKVKHPLCFIISYVQPITQQYKSRTVRKLPLQIKVARIRMISIKEYGWFPLQKEATICYHQIDTYHCQQD